jgi:hypothetical protein
MSAPTPLPMAINPNNFGLPINSGIATFSFCPEEDSENNDEQAMLEQAAGLRPETVQIFHEAPIVDNSYLEQPEDITIHAMIDHMLMSPENGEYYLLTRKKQELYNSCITHNLTEAIIRQRFKRYPVELVAFFLEYFPAWLKMNDATPFQKLLFHDIRTMTPEEQRSLHTLKHLIYYNSSFSRQPLYLHKSDCSLYFYQCILIFIVNELQHTCLPLFREQPTMRLNEDLFKSTIEKLQLQSSIPIRISRFLDYLRLVLDLPRQWNVSLDNLDEVKKGNIKSLLPVEEIIERFAKIVPSLLSTLPSKSCHAVKEWWGVDTSKSFNLHNTARLEVVMKHPLLIRAFASRSHLGVKLLCYPYFRKAAYVLPFLQAMEPKLLYRFGKRNIFTQVYEQEILTFLVQGDYINYRAALNHHNSINNDLRQPLRLICTAFLFNKMEPDVVLEYLYEIAGNVNQLAKLTYDGFPGSSIERTSSEFDEVVSLMRLVEKVNPRKAHAISDILLKFSHAYLPRITMLLGMYHQNQQVTNAALVERVMPINSIKWTPARNEKFQHIMAQLESVYGLNQMDPANAVHKTCWAHLEYYFWILSQNPHEILLEIQDSYSILMHLLDCKVCIGYLKKLMEKSVTRMPLWYYFLILYSNSATRQEFIKIFLPSDSHGRLLPWYGNKLFCFVIHSLQKLRYEKRANILVEEHIINFLPWLSREARLCIEKNPVSEYYPAIKVLIKQIFSGVYVYDDHVLAALCYKLPRSQRSLVSIMFMDQDYNYPYKLTIEALKARGYCQTISRDQIPTTNMLTFRWVGMLESEHTHDVDYLSARDYQTHYKGIMNDTCQIMEKDAFYGSWCKFTSVASNSTYLLLRLNVENLQARNAGVHRNGVTRHFYAELGAFIQRQFLEQYEGYWIPKANLPVSVARKLGLILARVALVDYCPLGIRFHPVLWYLLSNYHNLLPWYGENPEFLLRILNPPNYPHWYALACGTNFHTAEGSQPLVYFQSFLRMKFDKYYPVLMEIFQGFRQLCKTQHACTPESLFQVISQRETYLTPLELIKLIKFSNGLKNPNQIQKAAFEKATTLIKQSIEQLSEDEIKDVCIFWTSTPLPTQPLEIMLLDLEGNCTRKELLQSDYYFVASTCHLKSEIIIQAILSPTVGIDPVMHVKQMLLQTLEQQRKFMELSGQSFSRI